VFEYWENFVARMDAARGELQAEAIELLGVRIHTLSVDALLDTMAQTILARRKALVANVNVHAMNLAYQLPWFRTFLNSADIVFCDGFGVKWGARLVGLNISHRYTPPDWIPSLCSMCTQHDFSLFFLGARPGVAQKAAHSLKEHFPNLQVVGIHHGYFDKTPNSPENEAIIQRINLVKPNILIVGFGMPLQERWLMQNWKYIEANLALAGGAVFDYVSGELRRPPCWMTSRGLEWLGRLIIEPCRLWRRYVIGNPLFLWRVLKQRIGLLDR
jgi:N-acetylglucosaminyldiphosphoundecaprenol N-acetyl-beta-D-mannosaminyltransferase